MQVPVTGFSMVGDRMVIMNRKSWSDAGIIYSIVTTLYMNTEISVSMPPTKSNHF
jgi:hypothetical protein